MTDIYPVGKTIYWRYPTRDGTPVPITEAGDPAVAILKDGETTPRTYGVSLSIDSVWTGNHLITIDTTQGDGYYEADSIYFVCASSGTVDGNTVVGEPIYAFRLGNIQSDVQAWNGGAVPSLATAASLATVEGKVDGIAAKTTNLPADPADESLIEAAIAAAHAITNGKVDGLNDLSASEVDQALADYGAAKPSDLTNLDAPVSSRLAAEDYVAPDNDGIVAVMEDTGTTLPGLIAALNIDQGSIMKIYTVTDTDEVTPLPDVRVKVTTGSDGSGYVTTKYTDLMGQAVFMLDPGTYYLWRRKAGKRFVNPDIEVVSDE